MDDGERAQVLLCQRSCMREHAMRDGATVDCGNDVPGRLGGSLGHDEYGCLSASRRALEDVRLADASSVRVTAAAKDEQVSARFRCELAQPVRGSPVADDAAHR